MNIDIKSVVRWSALCLAGAFSLVSCTALDDAPDNRTEIGSADKIQKLLTSGYPVAVPALLCELSSDNFVDDNVVVPATHNDAYQDFHEQAYAWQVVDNYSTGDNDTPYSVWEANYQGIAVANHAIEAMLNMSDDPANDKELAHSWGEAHLLRAYLHFVLVNVFAQAYKNEAQSSQDVGIPYVSEVENTVNVDYSDPKFRKSVAEVYRLIERDILEGINLIDDSKYTVPAYHFNRNAANAFAARFYLYKRDYEKCLKYANAALGSTPSLRNWKSINKNTIQTKQNDYNDEKLSWNFLIQATYSLQWRALVTNARFAINTGITFKDASGKNWRIPSTLDVTIWGSGPNWSGTLPAFSGMVYINRAGQQYGAWLFRLYEYFEYTDKIAGIGYVHQIYQPFTADETILCRAEAKLYMGDRDGAIRDLELWTSAHLVTDALTLDKIKRKYRRDNPNNDFVSELHPQEMGFEKVLEGDDLSVLDCILHFRRIETIHEGLRWFDVKRYGIKVYHHYRDAHEDEIHTDSLNWDDPRRALQIPDNVIQAGYPSSPRDIALGGGTSGGYKVPANRNTHLELISDKQEDEE